MAPVEIVFLVLATITFTGTNSGELGTPLSDCDAFMEELGGALSGFDKCTRNYSKSFEVCLQCAAHYETAHTLLDDVINMRTPRTKKCENLVKHGKASLMTVSFRFIRDIWNIQGACGDCVAPDSFNISESVRKFYELRSRLTRCVDEFASDDSLCYACGSKFHRLTDHFHQIRSGSEAKGRRMCLDVFHAMNTTWIAWGDRCPPSKTTHATVLAVELILLLIIVVIVIRTRRRKPRYITIP